MTTTNERTFTEMLHGDIRWMKQRDIADRMMREGKTEMVLHDVESMRSVHFSVNDYIDLITSEYSMMGVFRSGMGYGRGMHAKRKMRRTLDVVAEINKRHPALAAEHRVGGMKAERSIALEMKRLRDWKKLNWALYYGRATHRTLEGRYSK